MQKPRSPATPKPRRRHQINFRVTQEELDRIRSAAAAKGLTVSEYFRFRLLAET